MSGANWTAASVQWPYKLMFFNGYDKLERLRAVNRKGVKVLETLDGNKLVRLFDLQGDAEELHDLAVEQPEIVKDMLQDLEAALGELTAGG